MNKKGMTVSINAIVVLIIAIVTLVLILGFVNDWFRRVEIPFPELGIDPTADNPIIFTPKDVARGHETPMSIGFYNNELAAISTDVKPAFFCEGLDPVTVKVAGLNIEVGQHNTYKALVSVPDGTPSGTYPCRLTISETEAAFTLTVK